jgi:iron complex outermembrane receptor protein
LQVSVPLAQDVQLRSISGYRRISFSAWHDGDTGAFASNEVHSTELQRQLSQEFLVTANPIERLNLLGGIIWFKETGRASDLIPTQAVPLAALGVPVPVKKGFYTLLPVNLGANDIDYHRLGIYTNASWKLTSTVTVSGGVRWSKEDKALTLEDTFAGFPLGPGSVGTRSQFSDSPTVYDTRVQWQATEDVLLYAKYGTGYRAGGVNYRAVNSTFGPERVQTVEVGDKSDFHLGTMPARLNVAVFHSKYHDFQVPVVITVPTISQTVVNAGEATINGLEAELTVRPIENLDVGANVSWLDAYYNSFIIPGPSSLANAAVDLSDNRLRKAPRVSTAFNLGYRVPLGTPGDLRFEFDLAYQSAQEQDPVFQADAPLTDVTGAPTIATTPLRTNIYHQGGYALLNAQIRWENVFNSGVNAWIWGKNLTDKNYLAYNLHVGPVDQLSYGEPRIIGISLRKNF